MRPLRTYLCAHDYLRVFDAHRIALRCAKCGHETPGWRDDDLPRPRVIFPGPIAPVRALRVVAARKRRTA